MGRVLIEALIGGLTRLHHHTTSHRIQRIGRDTCHGRYCLQNYFLVSSLPISFYYCLLSRDSIRGSLESSGSLEPRRDKDKLGSHLVSVLKNSVNAPLNCAVYSATCTNGDSWIRQSVQKEAVHLETAQMEPRLNSGRVKKHLPTRVITCIGSYYIITHNLRIC